MADVRSLLRQERASRQQTQKKSAVPAGVPTSRKRKAADDSTEERKRTRTEAEKGVPAGFFDGGAPRNDTEPATAQPARQTAPETTEEQVQEEEMIVLARDLTDEGGPHVVPMSVYLASGPQPGPVIPTTQAADEELDAFINEIESAPEPQRPLAAYSSAAVIEAAPMTAAELAAQAREEQSAQRGKREEELEAEKEDAQHFLEDEFEEMEGLEERVKKLREKREALRQARGQAKTVDIASSAPLEAEMDEASESEDEDEEWDDWRFRPA